MDEQADTPAEEDDAISKVGIIGAGVMGGGIAQVFALAGYQVRLQDISADKVQHCLLGIKARLGRVVSKQAMPAQDCAEAIARIAIGTALEFFADCDLVIETAVEDEQVKFEIFERLCPILPEHTIVCTNTSSLSVTLLATHTDRPERFMGMHFMNPAPLMRLVEIIRGLTTNNETVAAVKRVVKKLGKTAVSAQDYPAFIVNRILLPMINEAIFALHEGVGTVEFYRRRDETRHQHAHGSDRTRRLYRPGRVPEHHACALRRHRRLQVPSLPAPGKIRRSRLARPQVRLRVLQL